MPQVHALAHSERETRSRGAPRQMDFPFIIKNVLKSKIQLDTVGPESTAQGLSENLKKKKNRRGNFGENRRGCILARDDGHNSR